jgi:hypothetical protein
MLALAALFKLQLWLSGFAERNHRRQTPPGQKSTLLKK